MSKFIFVSTQAQAPMIASATIAPKMIQRRTVAVIILLAFACSLSPTAVLAQSTIDDPCDPSSSTAQCTGSPFLECVPLYNMFSNGTCRCKTGTFWHPQALQCRVGASGTCNRSPDQPVCTPNSDCDQQTSRCTCRSDFYIPSIGFFCVTGIGRPCGDATADNAQCDITKRLVCDNSVCSCSGRDIWSESRGKCLATVATSSPCSVDDDCVENSICTVSNFGIARCRCAPGFTENEANTCSLSYGASCDPLSDEDSPNAPPTCNKREKLTCSAVNNTCVCANGLVPQNGVCRGLAGDSCETHTDCASGSSLLCHQDAKQCFCSQRENSIQLVDRTCGRLGINGYCRLGGGFQDCASLTSVNYLVCNHVPGTSYGRCGCQSGYELDANGRCRRPLGASCAPANHNCIENAACIHDTCVCLPGATVTADERRCLKTHGEFCNLGSVNPCNGDQGLLCVANSCQCSPGQEWSSDSERCVSLVSGNCNVNSSHAICTAHASCTLRGVCECDPGYSQHNLEDRLCRAAHGTGCNAEMPCNENQFLICSENAICECKLPLQQIWDPTRGTCASIVGGHCGTPLAEHPNRTMTCIPNAVCTLDSNLVQKCMCDRDAGWVPDANGGCVRAPVEEGTTTTTTYTPPTTTTSATRPPSCGTTTTTTEGPSKNKGASGGSAGGIWLTGLGMMLTLSSIFVLSQ